MRKSTPPLLAAGAVLLAAGAAALQLQPTAYGSAAAPTLDPDPLPTTSEVTPLPGPTGALGPDPTPIPEPAITGVPSDPGAAMPLDAYMTSMADIHTIDLAKDAATATCMASLGFSAWTAGVVRNWNPEDYVESDLVEPLDAAAAARSGYPRPALDPAVSAAAAKPEDQRAASPEEMQAYDGTAATTGSGQAIPEGDCAASGETKVLGQATALAADPRLLADDASFLALEHTAVKQSLEQWVTCMTAKGYAYDSPLSARADLRWAAREPGVAATQAEKQAAADDAACAQGANLLATYRTAKRAYEEVMVRDQRQALTESLSVFATWVERAEAVLAGR
ncbi:hypothetical protein MF672_015780 [Actinomadura sp. ATCC 31491]|uniref:DUF4439 domain-containing protein n=1 Tax=Actinomadura luzonensis TaxID=2805427 RepID=A0ABT0FTM4_9ACTN|nr:hypothetical protein [Actinomadura luzonensis]MCK2215236.1 hypothetical protein [Actinomadura luzonensis]